MGGPVGGSVSLEAGFGIFESPRQVQFPSPFSLPANQDTGDRSQLRPHHPCHATLPAVRTDFTSETVGPQLSAFSCKNCFGCGVSSQPWSTNKMGALSGEHSWVTEYSKSQSSNTREKRKRDQTGKEAKGFIFR